MKSIRFEYNKAENTFTINDKFQQTNIMDKISKEKRSNNMSKIRSKNTKPELLARRTLWRLGYRYRIHYEELPGKPDIALTKFRTVIFVHGCFWHRHKNCIEASRPKTNSEFWEKKIKKNIGRDKKTQKELLSMGWRVIVLCDPTPKN